MADIHLDTDCTNQQKDDSFKIARKSRKRVLDTDSDDDKHGSKRYRTAFRSDDLQRLEDEFTKENYLSRARRCELAKELNIPEQTIKIWFQNRRMKDKRNKMTMMWPYGVVDPRFVAYVQNTMVDPNAIPTTTSPTSQINSFPPMSPHVTAGYTTHPMTTAVNPEVYYNHHVMSSYSPNSISVQDYMCKNVNPVGFASTNLSPLFHSERRDDYFSVSPTITPGREYLHPLSTSTPLKVETSDFSSDYSYGSSNASSPSFVGTRHIAVARRTLPARLSPTEENKENIAKKPAKLFRPFEDVIS